MIKGIETYKRILPMSPIIAEKGERNTCFSPLGLAIAAILEYANHHVKIIDAVVEGGGRRDLS